MNLTLIGKIYVYLRNISNQYLSVLKYVECYSTVKERILKMTAKHKQRARNPQGHFANFKA